MVSKVMSHESVKKLDKFYVPTCPIFAGPVTYCSRGDNSFIEDL